MEIFNDISMIFQWYFNGIPMVFYFNGISMVNGKSMAN